MAEISVLPVKPEHRAAWDTLYQGYARFYRVEQTSAMRDTVWSWLMDPAHEVSGLVAVIGQGAPVGLAHYRPFARPLSASRGLFLDDLFVDPAVRGSGVADRLVESLAAKASAEGYSVLRWITAENNYRARGLYDRLAKRTQWVTYDMAP
ncbi:GNAT family N-acetyltransferase [Rhodoligotrophos ferricapiens]|uniref:GNAT family N-acetyltransferase n=1 Tax=Rhodoligotrophos ferricapiens TaxID=3069264 RepID=UPI00315DD300